MICITGLLKAWKTKALSCMCSRMCYSSLQYHIILYCRRTQKKSHIKEPEYNVASLTPQNLGNQLSHSPTVWNWTAEIYVVINKVIHRVNCRNLCGLHVIDIKNENSSRNRNTANENWLVSCRYSEGSIVRVRVKVHVIYGLGLFLDCRTCGLSTRHRISYGGHCVGSENRLFR